MNTLELNYFSEKNDDIDKYIDDLVLKINNDEIYSGNVVSNFIAATFNLNWLYDWEDVHGFMFETYPKVNRH